MAIDIDKFVHDQLSVWPAVAAKYRALKSAQTRQMTIGGILVTLQSNPGRMPIFDHGCPLCEENYLEHQHFLPFEGRKGRKYRILVNRAPIFPNHLVITRDVHVPQTIWHRYPDMLDLAVQFPDYVIFYNSPYSGTTVPGHAHFQACPKGYMPLERIAGRLLHNIAMNGGQVPESLSGNVSFVDSVRDAQLFHFKHFTRGVFLLRAETAKSMAKMFYRLLDCCDLAEGEAEPRFNALTFFSEGEYRAVVTCRAKHRPHHFYAEGEDHFALSPGAADMAGFFVIPEVSDYERLTPAVLTEILQEISLSEKQEKRLLWRLVRTQPKIEVGILSGPEITFEIISDGAGPQKVSYREGKIDYNGTLYDELVFEAPTISTLFAEPSFILYGVTIGVDFHWQRQQDQQFAGTLKFIVDEGKVVAVLKAHAVISRSWVMAQIAHRKARRKASAPYSFDNVPSLVTWLDASQPAEAGQPVGEIIKWFDHDDHHHFDVCADDHCQRYQGLTLAVGEKVRAAIDETWGLTLRSGGELVDARFYKCCGGRTERFSTAWADEDYPYLTVHDDPWCDTHDKEILSQVLNDYDLETEDFHDWTVRYKRADLAALITKRSGVDIGDLVALEPLERGGSGRIKKLRIVGSKTTLTVGKELIIRRFLSESHLYSSWFDVEMTGDEVILHGHGWGHGVGLCQIGAAVMAAHGKTFEEILSFYYPGTTLER